MYECTRYVAAGHAALQAGDRDRAAGLFGRALRIVNSHGPAVEPLETISRDLFEEAIRVRDSGDTTGAIERLVRSVELNPRSAAARAELERLLALEPDQRDVTRHCYIMRDGARAEAIYREAIRRCVEFVTTAGIDGEVLEFGVLGGWTARLFAEAIRDHGYLVDLYLFDSFEGLPAVTTEVDARSYDVTRGIWAGTMKPPSEHFGGIAPEVHIRDRLARVISRSRIKIHTGFYSSSLQEPLNCKAAIVHLDCDLYISTKQVLDGLDRHGVMQDGTVLMFDDWNCHRANPAFGQRRALAEFLDARRERLSVSPFFTYGPNSASFILHVNAEQTVSISPATPLPIGGVGSAPTSGGDGAKPQIP